MSTQASVDTTRLDAVSCCVTSLRRLFAVVRLVWPLVGAVLILLGLSYETMSIMSSTRAYVNGESLWSKGHKDSVFHLIQYARTSDPADYERFQEAIKVPLGDQIARLNLDGPDPDRAVARAGFLQGGVHPDDVDGIIVMFQRFRNISFFAAVVDLWSKGDAYIDQLRVLGDDMHRLISAGNVDPAKLEALNVRLRAINNSLTPLTSEFSVVLGDASRTTRKILWIVMLSATGILMPLGLGLVGRILRRSDALRSQKEEAQRASVDARQREQATQLILDSTGDGILIVELLGVLRTQPSRAAREWFGAPSPDVKVWDYLHPNNSGFRGNFEVAFSQLVEGFLPFDLAATQMPSRFERDGKTFDLEYREVLDGQTLVRVLVLVRNATAAVEADKAQAEASEKQSAIGHILADKQGFHSFIDETRAQLTELASDDPIVVRRVLHTLKGNASIMGLSSVAALCHRLEDGLVDDPLAVLSAELRKELVDRFEARIESIGEFIRIGDATAIDLRDAEYSAFLSALRGGAEHALLLEIASSWAWDRSLDQLERLSAHIVQISRRLDKPVQVKISHYGLRVSREALAAFWPTLVHVVRNAVDHGIEDAATRAARGKAPTGTIELVTSLEGEVFSLEIRDDGKGIELAEFTAAAALRGHQVRSDEDVANVLFADGFSTKDEVTELSGRGVGLGAVRAQCEAVGGRTRVAWVAGAGMTFRFEFPAALARAVTSIAPAS